MVFSKFFFFFWDIGHGFLPPLGEKQRKGEFARYSILYPVSSTKQLDNHLSFDQAKF